MGEKDQENQREIQKIAVNVLDDEGEGTLAEIFFARFADGARRRVGPERFVVCAAIVVTSEAESAGRPEDEHGAGDRDRQPFGKLAEPGVSAGAAENFRGIKRREIGAEAVVIAPKRGPGGVDDERSETEES